MAILSLVLLIATRTHIPATATATANLRAYTWTLTQIDLTDSEYITPAHRVPYTFTAVGANWRITPTLGATVELALRLSRDGRNWEDWQPLIAELQGEHWFGENLIFLEGAQWMQARVTAPGKVHVDTLTLTAIDTSAAPTLAAARTHNPLFAAPAPAIISRAAWGADEGLMTWPPAYAPAHKIILHHTVTSGGDNPIAEIQAIYYYHAVTRGWGDIGYNYLVDKFGNIYEGRAGGPDVIAGHTYGYNTGSVGIGNLGDYTSQAPGAAMRAANVALAAWYGGHNHIHPLENSPFNARVTANIAGHRDYAATACPGNSFYTVLPTIRAATWDRISLYTPAYAAEFLSHTTPPMLFAGHTHTVALTLRNVGTNTWYRLADPGSGTPYRLGYHWYDAGGQQYVQPPEEDHRTPLLSDTSFGARATFSAALLTAPHLPGTYTLKWDMVHEGVTWFAGQGSPTLDVSILVTSPVTLTGIIHDNRGIGVSGAQVALTDGQRVTTEANGHYIFAPLFPGNATLQAYEPGIRHFPNGDPVYDIQLHGGETLSFTLALAPFDNVISNGGFETGLAGWETTQPPAGGFVRVGEIPHTGRGSAELFVLGGQSVTLYRAVQLPSEGVAPTLSLFYRAPENETTLKILVEKPGDTTGYTLPHATGWRHWWVAVDATPGTPITLTLQLQAAAGAPPTTVLVDEVTLGSGGAAGWRYRHLYLPLVMRTLENQ